MLIHVQVNHVEMVLRADLSTVIHISASVHLATQALTVQYVSLVFVLHIVEK